MAYPKNLCRLQSESRSMHEEIREWFRLTRQGKRQTAWAMLVSAVGSVPHPRVRALQLEKLWSAF